MFRLKKSKADKLFSDYIRLRDKYTCQRCGKHHPPPTPYIQAAHFYGRRGKSTRWDEDNAIALCGTIGFPGGCHGHFQDHPGEFKEFMIKRLGQKRFDALVVRAHTPTKVDSKLMAIYWKERLKEFDQ